MPVYPPPQTILPVHRFRNRFRVLPVLILLRRNRLPVLPVLIPLHQNRLPAHIHLPVHIRLHQRRLPVLLPDQTGR